MSLVNSLIWGEPFGVNHWTRDCKIWPPKIWCTKDFNTFNCLCMDQQCDRWSEL